MGWLGCGLIAAGLVGGLPAHALDITVADRLSPGQQEETIAVFFSGVLMGTLHVGPGTPSDSFVAPVSVLGSVSYTLCGKLLRREADGSVSSHSIDNGGRLRTAPGHTLDAVTRGDVLFLLQDSETGEEGEITPGPVCSAAVS